MISKKQISREASPFLMLFLIGMILGQLFMLFSAPSTRITQKDERMRYNISKQEKSYKVYCLVLTSTESEKYAWSVMNTWGQHCDRIRFFSRYSLKTGLPQIYPSISIGGNSPYSWSMLREGIRAMYSDANDKYSWYVVAQEDTFVVVDNLKRMLAKREPLEDIIVGHLRKRPFASLGSGIVFSKGALINLYHVIGALPECAIDGDYVHGEIILGDCGKRAEITFKDASTSLGKYRMFGLNLFSVINGQYPAWFKSDTITYPMPGWDCCDNDYVSSYGSKGSGQYEEYFFTHVLSKYNSSMPRKS